MTGQPPDVRICVLLACFAGDKRASKIRRALGKRIRGHGDSIMDEVVLGVDPRRRSHLHDPRKTTAGALTAALTWGVFGLVTGGLQGLGVWAVLGAICGGLFAIYGLHRFSKDERRRIGEHLPAGSSALAAFIKGPDPERILACAAPFGPVAASVAAIRSDLSARVWRAADASAGSRAGQASTPPQATQLSMLMVRFTGERSARQALAAAGSAEDNRPDAPRVELVVEADEHGKRRVVDPTMGPAAAAKSDLVSWGGFGLIYGAIVGFAGNGGVLGALGGGLVTAIAWGLFGLAAGALFGLWANRSVSARRLKGIGPLVPPGSSLAVGWADGSAPAAAVDGWLASGSERFHVRFVTGEHGLLLDAVTS